MDDQNTQSAVDFLQMVIAGNIDKAYEKYVDMSGKHHNAYTPAGFIALRQGMKDNDQQFPNKHFEIKHVVAEGNLVTTHSRLVLVPKEKELAVVHVFKFANGKIVEIWDVGQLVPADSPNKDGIF